MQSPLLTKRFHDVLAKIQEITIEELLQRMNQKFPCYIIDIREDTEWNQGAIPQAIHVPRGYLELKIEQITSDITADIILYCGGGTRSAFATESLQNMGYRNVKSLKGGFRAWQANALT